VKAHCGILLNECADQLATRGVQGGSYCPTNQFDELPADETESPEVFPESEHVITQDEEFSLSDIPEFFGQRVVSVGLAADVEREKQAEMFSRFGHDFLVATSAELSPGGGEDEGQSLIPEDSNVIVVGPDDQVQDEQQGPDWEQIRGAFPRQQATWADQMAAQQREREFEAQYSWMSDAERHMLSIPDAHPVSWAQFQAESNAQGPQPFKGIEQRYLEEGSVPPGPGSDMMIGAAYVLWSETMITVIKNVECNAMPTAVSGVFIE
jgi:hypothetical protein